MQQKQRGPTAEDVGWTNQVADDMAKNPEQATVFTKCFNWGQKILVPVGSCSHVERETLKSYVPKEQDHTSWRHRTFGTTQLASDV